MKVDLNNVFNIDGEVLQFQYDLDLSGYELGGIFPFSSPVSVKGSVKNNVGMVTVSAVAEFIFSGRCDRCAEDFQRRYKADIEHSLVRKLSNSDNDDYIVVENCQLDLDELVLSDILLFLPSKNLCSEECKGLCPYCGTNLNSSHCDCKKAVDPRLESLLQLLDN